MRPDEHLRDTTISTEIVVADTSQLNYLVQIRCDFLLPSLYQRVIAPPSVVVELSQSGAPHDVATWAKSLPAWVEVVVLTTEPDAKLSLLGPGERDAIQLAIELSASRVLIDEEQGRQEARSRGFLIVGTVGVLVAGEKAGLIDARSAFDRLVNETTFRTTALLRQQFLDALSNPKREG
jgi:hypothetical protein